VTVANAEGKTEPWAIEINGPSGLVRQGWRPKTLMPGMPITLTIHPLPDGTHGGQFMAVTLRDGTQIGNPTDVTSRAELAAWARGSRLDALPDLARLKVEVIVPNVRPSGGNPDFEAISSSAAPETISVGRTLKPRCGRRIVAVFGRQYPQAWPASHT
jgi:hypothetical protein